MKWTDWVTPAIAILGAVLGLYNAWQGWADRRVKLRVRPTYAEPAGGHHTPLLSINVTNLSAFPVTIDEVGLLRGRPTGELPARAPFFSNVILNGQELPARMERHEAITVTIDLRGLPRTRFYKAYALTSARHLGVGDSPALQSILEALHSTLPR